MTNPDDNPTDHVPSIEMSISGSHGVLLGDHGTQTNIGVDVTTLPVQRIAAGAVVHNLPAGAGVFVGRDLLQLDSLLHGAGSGVVVGQAAVHGLGGIGKTELVLHYAHANADRYQLVWWITADTAENVGLGLSALTDRLHPMATLTNAQAWAIGWLQSNHGWLLVLDNVENTDDITPILGQITRRGHVVVTTRRDLGTARWAQLGLSPLRLDVLDRAASIQLLTRLTGLQDMAAAHRLAADLGDLPLALEQAAAYISQHHGLDFDSYRKLLDAQFARLAAAGGEGGNTQRTVASVWRVTMDAIKARSPLAIKIMNVLAWLAPEALPDDVLTPMTDDPVDLGDALAILTSYNMISWNARLLGVHRLVQAVTRADTQPKIAASVVDDDADKALRTGIPNDPSINVAGWPRSNTDAAADLLAAAVPDDPVVNVAGWVRWTALLPHIDSLAASLAPEYHSTTMLWLQERAATFRIFQGQLTPALEQLERVCADYRRILGDDHPDSLNSQNSLARGYRVVGRVTEAIDLYENVLAVRRRILGENDRKTLSSQNNLALAYRMAGRVTEAITLYEQTLGIRARVLGNDDPDTLISQSNLAYAYNEIGRVAEAIVLHERTLTDRRRILGNDHPSTLITQNNLARAYQTAGRIADATALHEKTLVDRRKILGNDHPDTLITQNNLACAYQAAGRVAEAIALHEKTLADRHRALGNDHPDTLDSQSNLARAYEAAGVTAEAIARCEPP